jgi:hypothetical protein
VKGGVSDEAFIRAWQSGTSAKQVAEGLGMGRDACRSKASYFRSIGIPLRTFYQADRRAEDLPRLAELARSLAPKTCPCGRGEEGLCITCHATRRNG